MTTWLVEEGGFENAARVEEAVAATRTATTRVAELLALETMVSGHVRMVMDDPHAEPEKVTFHGAMAASDTSFDLRDAKAAAARANHSMKIFRKRKADDAKAADDRKRARRASLGIRFWR